MSGRRIVGRPRRHSQGSIVPYVQAGLNSWELATNAYNWVQKNKNKHQGPPTGPFGYPLSYKKRKVSTQTLKMRHSAGLSNGHTNPVYSFGFGKYKFKKHVAEALKDVPKRLSYVRAQGRMVSSLGAQSFNTIEENQGPGWRAVTVLGVTADSAAYYENNVHVFSVINTHLLTNNSNVTADIEFLHFQCKKATSQTPQTLFDYGETNITGGTVGDSLLYNTSWHDQSVVKTAWKLVGNKEFILGPGETIRYHSDFNINKKFNLSWFSYRNETYLPGVSTITIVRVRGGQVISLGLTAAPYTHTASTTAACAIDYITEGRVMYKPYPVGMVNTAKINVTGALATSIPALNSAYTVNQDTDVITTEATAGA